MKDTASPSVGTNGNVISSEEKKKAEKRLKAAAVITVIHFRLHMAERWVCMND